MKGHDFTIAIIIFALLSGASAAQNRASVELVLAGQFRGPGPYPESGQRWLAASRTESGLALVETSIEVTEVPDPCSGTATRITAGNAEEPLFLVRGSPLFQPGPLATVFDERRFIFPAESLSLRLESGEYFGLTAYGSAAPAVGGVLISNYKIVMRRATRSQTLGEFDRIGLDGPPELIWAGDLDRDGYADALLDLTTSYAGNHYVLFLSFAASDNKLVERAAEFPVSGC